MKFVVFLLLIVAAVATPYPEPQLRQLRDISVVRSGSDLQLAGQRWTAAGGNIYWLGLDENVIPPPGQPFYAPTNASYPTKGRTTEIMNTLNTMGARAFRCHTCGISVGNPLSIWPTLGETNEQAFEPIDWAVYQARAHGLRLFAPLTDNYDYYHGGKCVFLRWRGIDITCLSNVTLSSAVQQFYLNETVVSDFKDYIRTLLTHKNVYTGLTYAEDPTIFAYETGNELGGPTFGDMDVPVSWTTEIAQYIKDLAPQKLVIDGTYGVVPNHLDINEVDIYSDHFYPPNNTKLQADLDLVSNASKVYIAGEYDWTGNNPDGSSLDSWFGIIEQYQAAMKQVIAGDHFWSLFMHNVPNCTAFVQHNDGFTLHYNDPSNTAFNNTQIAKVRKHLFKMMGEDVGDTLPPVACPGPLWTS